MQTIGPYRLLDVLGRCEIGAVWSAVDAADGTPATLAILDEAVAEDDRWRRAFSVTANALSRVADGGLPVIGVDFTAPGPWVACTPEPGLGPAQIFVALGVTFNPSDAAHTWAKPAPAPPPAEEPAQIAVPDEPFEVRPLARRHRSGRWVAIGVSLATLPAAGGILCAVAHAPGRDPRPPAAVSSSHVPGTFAVSQKLMIPGAAPSDERQRVRLAVYSFRKPSSDPNFMTFRMDAWMWDTTTARSDTIADCEPGSVIGNVVDGSEPGAADAGKAPQCPARGLGEPQQRFGTFCGPDAASPDVVRPGDEFTIYWHDQPGNSSPGCRGTDLERWRYSPRSLNRGKLAMIELITSSEIDPRYTFYAASDPYQPDALNVGWGFGAFTTLGPKGGETMRQIAGHILTDGVVYEGYWKSWNNWCEVAMQRNESVRRVSTAVQAFPWKETDGALGGGEPAPKLRIRDRTRSATQSHDVFIYVSVPANQQASFTNRRINLSSGNDFNDNGHIADNFGHTQSGLQIIDADGAMVGFVTVEIGHGNGGEQGRDTVSALYYLRNDLTPDQPIGTVRC